MICCANFFRSRVDYKVIVKGIDYVIACWYKLSSVANQVFGCLFGKEDSCLSSRFW